MQKILIVHGRQPGLGRAELESIYGPEKVFPVGKVASLVDAEPQDLNFSRLGTMVKFCKVLLELETTSWDEITDFLCKTMPEQAKNLEEGRLTLGFSIYGLRTDIKSINNTAIKVKKAVKATGRSVRIVPNKDLALNSAQVFHNGLTRKLGWELVLVRDRNRTIVAQSIAVQDIGKYTARDQRRPYRDAKVGMLPPKLAQIIINLAVGPSKKTGIKIYDPFCGTGVILQEALLMGYGIAGSDINPRMVEYSDKNLKWLISQSNKFYPREIKPDSGYSLSIANAVEIKLSKPCTIASEIFLGRPLSIIPEVKKMKEITEKPDEILKDFLKNIAHQTKTGFRLCLALPAWKTKNGFWHLSTLDKLDELGYNRLKFVHADNKELIYHRPDQIVARELVVLERK